MSEAESSDEDDQGSGSMGLIGFLFGNIDKQGNLEDNFLDDYSKRKLNSLAHVLDAKQCFDEDDDEAASSGQHDPDTDSEFDSNKKVDDAQDFSNIDEALTDDSSSSSSENGSSSDEANDEEGASKSAPSSTDRSEYHEPQIKKTDNDRDLMPPPVGPPSKLGQIKVESQITEKSYRRPLEAMLPEKYKNIDVRELFPEFRPNQVLRFTRLFPIKATSKPKLWKNVKKLVKKKSASTGEETDSNSKAKGCQLEFSPMPEDASMFVQDQAVWFHKHLEEELTDEDDSQGKKTNGWRGPKATDWRFGPAQYWYDLLELPEKVEEFDYGLKLGQNPDTRCSVDSLSDKAKDNEVTFSEDAFLMVTQMNWEEDVVWNGDDIKHKVLQKLNSKTNAAGWVPSSYNRTASTFSQPGKTPGLTGIRLQTIQHKKPATKDETWHSIFPVENEELVYGRWEDEIIWDTENMPIKLEPKFVSLDPNDDNIILGIPDDIDPSTLPPDEPVRKVKIIQKHVKKSRMLLNRSGIINVIEEEGPPPPPKTNDKDPFNISNDEYYAPKTQDNLIKVASGGGVLQHATPVVELQVPFVPTHMGPIKLRAFHRPPLKRYSHGVLAEFTRPHPVMSLSKYMRKRAKQREAEREAAGGGDIFFMRTPDDISGKDGEIVLFEHIEEHPPLLSLVGMCSKIKSYYKKKPKIGTEDTDEPSRELLSNFPFGELTIAHTSPFLGQMMPGQLLQAIENNLYRSPIYQHRVANTDFLVIRTRNEYSIRELDGLFVVGQECPLYEVPAPNSKRANNFTRDFLQVFIYRLFWKSRDNPRRIKMDEIKKAFASHSESSIRKRLKPCAEFHRTGADSNWWVIKSGFRLPTEDEIRAMVSPEQCCAYFSMIAAEQRLKDAGYGEKSLLAPQDDEDEEASMKLDDEVKAAPWNTTRAYILAMKGKCLLQLTGPADPTGKACEGFSYVRIPNKPTNKEDLEQQPKRTVTGTDADLRKLPLKDARAILRQNGLPEDVINKLSRWEVIDVVRTLSTEKVKAGEEFDHKFSRGNRFSIAEHQERYREECQRIFDVQNGVLASSEILSSDEADTSSSEDNNDDEDLDELGKNMEKMLSNKKSSSQIMREREEMERRDLRKMILEGEAKQKENKKRPPGSADDPNAIAPNRVLKITRVFRNEAGKEYTRTEIVRKPLVVETYVRVRQTKDEGFIKKFATLDEQVKEEMKKEKRRIQEQLRRIKRNQEKERLGATYGHSKSGKKLKAKPNKPDLKLKCGACGAKGHMRTNKACPKFVPEENDNSVTVAMTEKDEEEMEKELEQIEETEELVNVDGTKVKLSSKVLKHADEIRRRSMILKVPKQAMRASLKRRRAGTVEHCDYLTNKNYKPVERRRTDPVITLASFLDKILLELRGMDEALQFLQPVNTKKVSDYLDKIKHPMDLQTIRDNVQKKRYHSREDFLSDVNQIVENSSLYNGENDIYTVNARKLLDVVIQRFSENEEKLMRLEKAINPLLDDNDQVALTYILQSILNDKIKSMQESWPFMKPVNRKLMKNYYEIIKEPMDLEIISQKVAKHAYHSRADFRRDIELLYSNSLQYNGEVSEYTMKAQRLLEMTDETLDAYADHLASLEAKIQEAKQRALDQADVESIRFSLDLDDNSKLSATDMAGPHHRDLMSKRKRGRPRKVKHPLSKEFIDAASPDASEYREEDSRTNLEEDLQYSSDEENEDWQEVDDSSITVTVDHRSNAATAFYPDPMGAADERKSDDDDQVIVLNDEEIDENYDPTDFLQNLPGQQNHSGHSTSATATSSVVAAASAGQEAVAMGVPVELSQAEDGTMVINALPPPPLPADDDMADVIHQDLDMSDSDDDDDDDLSTPHEGPKGPEPPPQDEDGIWF